MTGPTGESPDSRGGGMPKLPSQGIVKGTFKIVPRGWAAGSSPAASRADGGGLPRALAGTLAHGRGSLWVQERASRPLRVDSGAMG